MTATSHTDDASDIFWPGYVDAVTDTASYSGSSLAVIVSLATGTGTGCDAQGDTLSSIENLTAGDVNANTLIGGDGADSLISGADTDTLMGYGNANSTLNLSSLNAQNFEKLDVKSDIVERLSQMQGITLVVVSHNSKVLSMTQRLIVLEQGRLLADGLTEKMLKS